MKFVMGVVLGVVLSIGGTSLMAQREKVMHPRIAKAITAIRDAEDYMKAAPHDFGGHRVEAIRACDDAVRQLNLALEYRARRDR